MQLHRWLDAAQERIAFQGLPSRICWLGMGEREKAAQLFKVQVHNASYEKLINYLQRLQK